MEAFLRKRLRDLVFGTQDGLISTLGALTGIAEGTRDREIVVLAGMVVVAVESLSMAAGSYLSSKAQREYLQRLLKEEKRSILENPDHERRELREMYRARGFTDPEIAVLEKRLLSDPSLLLEDMAHKELGICPGSLEDPRGNALVMGLTYLCGGSVPILPYLFLPMPLALAASMGCTLLALFALGGMKGRIVHRNGWLSGLEMLGVAGLAALAGFLVGRFARIWIL